MRISHTPLGAHPLRFRREIFIYKLMPKIEMDRLPVVMTHTHALTFFDEESN